MNLKTIVISAVAAVLLAAGGLYFLSTRGGTQEISARARSGAKEDELLSIVEKSSGKFNLSADDILALKKDGVSDDVIISMIRHKNADVARSNSDVKETK